MENSIRVITRQNSFFDRFDYKVRRFKYKLFSVFFKKFRIRIFTLSVVNFNSENDRLIESIIKKNGFVEMNKRGEFYVKEFTVIQLVRDYNKNIIEVRLKHDIDSVVSEKAKELKLAARVTGLQKMIDYFGRI